MSREFIQVENEHWYPSPTIEGKYYPSVTTILKAFPKGVGFDRYLANQESWESSQDTLKKAGERGTRVHDASEQLERGEALHREAFNLDEWQLLTGFVAWHQKYKPKAILIEKGLVSDNLRTGGTVDRLYEIDDEDFGRMVVVFDLKTSKAIHDSYWLQTAVYRELIIEAKIAIPTHTAILRLANNRKLGYEYQIREIEDIENDFKAFESVQAVWNYQNPKASGPKIIEVPDILKL